MHKSAGIIGERIEPIATRLTLEQGKPIAEARGEVASAAGLLAYFAEEGKRVTGRVLPRPAGQRALRSEEHTSELQSLMRSSYAVFCLKKKNKKTNHDV